MALDESKTNPYTNLPIYSSSEWFWMRRKPTLQGNRNQFTDFNASQNGFGCIQTQYLDKCEQISHFKAHEDRFGCIQNQPAAKYKSIDRYVENYPREMQTNSLILEKNPQINEHKSADFSPFENCFR
jgi:hypothetical protein